MATLLTIYFIINIVMAVLYCNIVDHADGDKTRLGVLAILLIGTILLAWSIIEDLYFWMWRSGDK